MSDSALPSYILPLASEQATLEAAGGKGAGLGRLAGAGLPVPGGFILTTGAYLRFVEANPLAGALQTAEPESEAIAGCFTAGEMPADVADAVAQAYAALGGVPVAVRSSATVEDLPGQSFAGQQETFLNVQGEAVVLDAVRSCWASLWSRQAVSYRRQMGVGDEEVVMAVVIQRMVAAEAAGVAFTANPTSGRRDEIVIAAAYGLGEAVVGGLVTPDQFVLDRESLKLKEAAAGDKAVEVRPGPEQGTVKETVSEDRRTRPALTEDQLAQLARLCLEVEVLSGGTPQDIEWAWGEGQFWLLQARPVTALPEPAETLEAVTWTPPIPGSSWVRRQVVEHMPEPLSPLFDGLYLRQYLEEGMEVMQTALGVPELGRKAVASPAFTTVNGYAYMRMDLQLKWYQAPALMAMMAWGIPNIFRSGIRYWAEQARPEYLQTIESWKGVDPALASDERLLEGVRALARADAIYWSGVSLAVGAAKVAEAVLGKFLPVAGGGLSSADFLRGFPSKAIEAEAALEAVAERIRADPELRAQVAANPAGELPEVLAAHPGGAAALEAWQGYLDEYGHPIYSLDFAVPTLAEEPLPALIRLKSLVADPGVTAAERQERWAEERQELEQRTLRRLDPARRAVLRVLLRLGQRFAPYREEALFYVGAAWPVLRRLVLELGRRLKAQGTVDAVDDVFFLKPPELDEALRKRARQEPAPGFSTLVRERRRLLERRKQLHPPPAVPPAFTLKIVGMDFSNREGQRRNRPDSPVLKGFAVSPGQVRAPASVIRSTDDFEKMEPGTILVCPMTTPAWTPLFAQARGLVTDIGGVLAHGSIVAREFGIPAVMGTGSATQRIAHGQVISIDGNAGTVECGPQDLE